MTRWQVHRVPRSVIEKEIEFNRDNLLNTFDRFLTKRSMDSSQIFTNRLELTHSRTPHFQRST